MYTYIFSYVYIKQPKTSKIDFPLKSKYRQK